MTKKDYVLIARELKQVKPPQGASDEYTYGALQTWNKTVEAITFALSRDNARFDQAKFRAACGYGK